jgi:hypothetical protein
VDLDILPCSGVQVAAGIFFRDVRDSSQLLRSNPPERKLDAHHLDTGLPLAIDTPGKTQAAEFVFINLTPAEKPDLFFKIKDIARNNGVGYVF